MVFNRLIDFITLKSERPVGRLLAYYAFVIAVIAGLVYFFPATNLVLIGSGIELVSNLPLLLQDGLVTATAAESMMGPKSLVELVLSTGLILIGALALMLPVSWVYMSARRVPGHSQDVVQTLIILPLVVAGIVLVVKDSLALAFSLAGVVAAVRFRATLRDTRDVVFIFLAIAVGFAAGVQTLAIGLLLTIVFNFVLLFSWKYDFGRNVLTPTAASSWSDPLNTLASENGHGTVPDRDLVLTLSPKKADALAKRFERVSSVLGSDRKNPRYNAVLSMTSTQVDQAMATSQRVLAQLTKRWMLDEVITNTGKASELYYLIRQKKTVTRDQLLTAIREQGGEHIASADLELGNFVEPESKEPA